MRGISAQRRLGVGKRRRRSAGRQSTPSDELRAFPAAQGIDDRHARSLVRSIGFGRSSDVIDPVQPKESRVGWKAGRSESGSAPSPSNAAPCIGRTDTVRNALGSHPLKHSSRTGPDGDGRAIRSQRAASSLRTRCLLAVLLGAFAAQSALPVLHASERASTARHHRFDPAVAPSHRAAVPHRAGAAESVAALVRAAAPRHAPSSAPHDPISCPLCWSLLHAGSALSSRAPRAVACPDLTRSCFVLPVSPPRTLARDDHSPRAPPAEAASLV
jgi:hypothetical protein